VDTLTRDSKFLCNFHLPEALLEELGCSQATLLQTLKILAHTGIP
jgi:hypothetical protein